MICKPRSRSSKWSYTRTHRCFLIIDLQTLSIQHLRTKTPPTTSTNTHNSVSLAIPTSSTYPSHALSSKPYPRTTKPIHSLQSLASSLLIYPLSPAHSPHTQIPPSSLSTPLHFRLLPISHPIRHVTLPHSTCIQHAGTEPKLPRMRTHGITPCAAPPNNLISTQVHLPLSDLFPFS